MPPEFFEEGKRRKHPLEDLLGTGAWEILTAIQHGSRAVTDVKGKVAEYYLDRGVLQDLQRRHALDSYLWNDRDGQPDFIIESGGQTIRVECKNVRSGKSVFPDGYKIELQKTRHQLSGQAHLRGYPANKFDILAACLFNQTGKWEYLFVATKDLVRVSEHLDYLDIWIKVPYLPGGVWKGTLMEVLNELMPEIEG